MSNSLGLSSPHISTLRSAEGGAVVDNRLFPARGGARGGGVRGEIRTFSRGARRRLLNFLNSIDRNRTPLPTLVTLTYPNSWPGDPRVWKGHLEAFRSRMFRRYGEVPVVWRLEYQRRGAPHFHMLLFAEFDLTDLIPFVARGWYEIVGSGDDRHQAAGTRCERVRSWRGTIAYAAKYLGETERLQAGQKPPGRFWGVWYKKLLRIEMVEADISLADAYKIRRSMARYAGIPLKRYAHSGRFQIYMPDECARRLLDYYGYRRF
jgi:hypothetical protein